jgi:coiled-coil domain-containing protein 130
MVSLSRPSRGGKTAEVRLLDQTFPDTEAKPASADPLAALEKSTDAQNNLVAVQIPRLESLYKVSDHYNSDPYAMSTKIRKRFRQEKKTDLAQKKVDDTIKDRYGLPDSLTLLADDPSITEDAKSQWEKGRQELRTQASAKRRRLDAGIVPMRETQKPSSVSTLSSASIPSSQSKSLETLRARILENTARQSNALGMTRKKPPNVNDGVVLR